MTVRTGLPPVRTANLSEVLRGRVGLSPVMVGRTGPLAKLLSIAEVAEIGASDSPEIVLVSGEAGVGKTRLVREFIANLPADVCVLAAHAQPGSIGRPFDMLAQIASDSGEPVEMVFDVVAKAVANGRTVLVLEDLHWADADSAHLVDTITEQPWPQLIVVGTYRPSEISRKAPGGELLARLEWQHNVEQVRLEGLDRAEVAVLLGAITGGAPSSAAVDAVFRRSAGNPFVVEELLRSTGPDVCIDDLLTAQLPWSLDDAIRQQLSGLDAEQRRVIDAVAVFGEPVPFEVLGELTELDDVHLLGPLRTLVDLCILIESSNDSFWFAHALMADVMIHQLLGRQRRLLHERALAALRARPNPDAATLARHADGAGRYDEIPAIARDGVSGYMNRGATFQALRLASDGLAEAPEDERLLAVATQAAWQLEFIDESLAYAKRWLAAASDDLGHVAAHRMVSRNYHELGDAAARDAALADLVTFASTLDPRSQAAGHANGALAQIHMIAYRPEQALHHADLALAAAERLGDEWLHAQATVERSSALGDSAAADVVVQALIEARDAARRVSDGVLECRALNNLLSHVPSHGPRGTWARNELRTASQRAGFDRSGELVLWTAHAAYGVGDMRAMRHAINEAGQYAAVRRYNDGLYQALQAALLGEEGRMVQAKAVWQMPGRVQTGKRRTGVARTALLAAAIGGDRDAAAAAFEAILGGERRGPGHGSSTAIVTVTDIVLLSVLAGLPARRIREELLGWWLDGHPVQADAIRHTEGLLLMAENRPMEAVEALEAVLAEPDERLFVPVIGSLRTALAAARLSAGDRAGALATVRQVVDVDLRLWPGWRRDRAEALLRRLEGQGGRAEGELTAREREVAALIVEGLTNGQLAERLFISPKTAAVHVSNILTKLGLSSRAEIAAWAVRHGAVLESR